MNSDLSLKCAAVGLPPPLISWKVDEMDVSTIHRARVHSTSKSDRIGTVSQLNISALRMEVSSHSTHFQQKNYFKNFIVGSGDQ